LGSRRIAQDADVLASQASPPARKVERDHRFLGST
jgi:hypothetical protein